tara:strand:+ start:735 stop:1103 length:369 start_codon:yes stop_codon:yes gene_type:complete
MSLNKSKLVEVLNTLVNWEEFSEEFSDTDETEKVTVLVDEDDKFKELEKYITIGNRINHDATTTATQISTDDAGSSGTNNQQAENDKSNLSEFEDANADADGAPAPAPAPAPEVHAIDQNPT